MKTSNPVSEVLSKLVSDFQKESAKNDRLDTIHLIDYDYDRDNEILEIITSKSVYNLSGTQLEMLIDRFDTASYNALLYNAPNEDGNNWIFPFSDYFGSIPDSELKDLVIESVKYLQSK